MLHHLTAVPFTASAVRALELSGTVPSAAKWWPLVRIAATTVSLLALSLRVCHVREVGGDQSSVIYALALITLASTLTQELLGHVLGGVCGGCPPQGLVSAALLVVVVAAVADALLFGALA